MSHTPRHDVDKDSELDNWDKAVQSGGCVQENDALLECKTRSGDWRACTNEVCSNINVEISTTDEVEMKAFKDCWMKKSKG